LRGAGSDHWMPYTQLFPANHVPCTLTYLGPETYLRNGDNTACIKRMIRRRPRPPLLTIQPTTLPGIECMGEAHAVYTDGSYTTTGTILQRFQGENTTTGGAAIVGRLRTNTYTAIRIEATARLHRTAGTLEILAQQLALRITNNTTPIFTDYAPGIQLRNNAPRQATGATRDLSYYGPNNRLRKVRAHPERRQAAGHWSADDLGIYLADRLAGGTFIDTMACPTTHVYSDVAVLQHLGSYNAINVLDTDYGGLATTTIGSRQQQQLLETYSIARDGYRIDRDELPKWTNTSTDLAHRLWMLPNTLERRAQITRICWDKHWTGRHQRFTRTVHNGMRDEEEYGTCRLCHGALEDQAHIIRDCQHPMMARIREHHLVYIRSALQTTQRLYPHMTEILAALHSFARCHPLGSYLWTGMLTQQVQAALAEHEVLHAIITLRTYQRIIQFLRLFAAAALDLYSMRTQLHDEYHGGAHHFNIRTHSSTDIQIRSVLARETIIGIDPAMALDHRGFPLTRADAFSPIPAKRTTLTLRNSEAIRQRHRLRKFIRPPNDTCLLQLPNAATRTGIG
jgi:hypothetical protein